MALTNDQRNIVNPNAPTLSEPEGSPVRSGVGYDYTNWRNKFVLDAIHESYNSYYEFPSAGFRLFPGTEIPENEPPVDIPDNIFPPIPDLDLGFMGITNQDLLAYCALYPQNGKVIPQDDGNSIIVPLSDEEANAQLNRMSTQLRAVNNYYTDSAPLSFDPENTNSRFKLVYIQPNHSAEYINRLRRALGKEDEVPLNTDPTFNNTIIPPDITTLISSNSTVDLDDWTANCEPGTETTKTYYNSRDRRFYYTERTNNTSPDYYDLSYYEDEESESFNTVKENLEKALKKGVIGILKAVGKFSAANQAEILRSNPKKAYIIANLDIRPASRWCFSVQISKDIIDDLPEIDSVSYEEDELWVLEKAQTLASAEKTPIAHRQTFIFDDLLDYIRSTQQMLELFNEDMAEEGIFSLQLASTITTDNPDDKSGLLFLEDEIARLNGFADFMQTFFAYNKRALESETVIELFLDDRYRLLHICANGELLSRGLGNLNYVKINDNQSVGTILNAFAFLTSTTFSYIMRSREIHEKFLTVAPGGVGTTSGEEWSIFLPEYTYPPVVIDPEAIKIAHEENLSLRRRKNTLFQRLSKVLNVSPEEAQILYQAKLSDKKWVRQRVTELVKGVNCSTAQAQLANDIVGFWNAANEKNNIRAVIRETIQILRRELSNDVIGSVTIGNTQFQGPGTQDVLRGANRINESLNLDPSLRSDAGLGDQIKSVYTNPTNRALLIRQVEDVINEQITCALDSFGNVLQNGFLDPLGLPPDSSQLLTRELHKPLTVKLQKQKTISMKKDMSDYYWKIIDAAIQQLLKSLITGIARDVFAASLGCAPNSTQTDQLDNTLKRYDFGYSMLSEHVGAVNLEQVALDAGLVTPPQNEEGRVLPPTPEQFEALLKDVSIMCTPAELQQLLFGEADNLLYDLIYETVSNGVVKVKIGEEPAEGFVAGVERRLEGGRTGMVPVFHIINPAVYASLVKTKDILREFFAGIGDALIPEELNSVDDLSFQSPLEAYCAGRSPNVEPLRLRVGLEQIQSQYIQVMDARINKINSLCQWLQNLSNIEAVIGDIFADLPLMDWYDNILKLLAAFSNFIASSIAQLLADIAGEDPPHSSAPDVQNIYNTRMGAELFFQNVTGGRPQHSVATTPDFPDPVYILWVSNGAALNSLEEDENLIGEVLGYPYIEDRSLLYSNATHISTRDSIEGSMQLPYQPASAYIDINAPGGLQYQTAYYSARVGPFSFRERLLPSLAEEPLDLEDSTETLLYGNRVIAKKSQQSWNLLPYTGFTSPIFLSCRSIANGGYNLRGINIKADGAIYEDLASWNPTVTDFESNPDSSQPLNGINAVMSYGVSSIGWDNNNDYRPDLVTKLPSINNPDVQRLMSIFFAGYTGLNPEEEYEPEPGETNIRPLISIANYTTTVERQLNNSYYNEVGKRRMPQYVNAINRDALKVLDDKCVTRDDARKANAILKVVQSRMQKFFLNSMIQASAYPHWNNLSTRKLVCSYLATNIVQDLTERSILGLVYENMNFIKKVYADEPENNFTLSESNTPFQNLVEFVEAMYVGMLNNIAKYSEYEQINKNAYSYYSAEFVENTGDENITVDRYDLTLQLFFQKMLVNLRLRQENAGGSDFGLTAEEITAAINYIEGNILQGDNIKNIGNYYFPLGVLTATQLIYADYSLNTAGRYSQTNYRLQLEAAGADDGLLTAFRGVTTSEFSILYRGFPQTITAYTQDNEITYYNTIEVERRLAYINGLITNVGDLVDNFSAIDFSPREIVDMSFQDFQNIIMPVIESYIANRVTEGNFPLEGFNIQYEPSVDLNFDYTEGLRLMSERWYQILTQKELPERSDSSFVGDVYHNIFGSPEHERRVAVAENMAGFGFVNLASSSNYLNFSQDVNPGIFTPSDYYGNWDSFYESLAFSKLNARRNNIGRFNEDADQNGIRFLLNNETVLFNALKPIYQAAKEEALTLENIRTERNSLQKLIIE